MRSVGVDHMLVEDHSILLGFFDGIRSFGVIVTFDLVGIVYEDDLQFVEGYSDFIDDVGFEKVKVQLTLSTHIEGESMNFAFHFFAFGSVPVILGTGRSKLDDVVPRFQFAGELAEIIPGG